MKNPSTISRIYNTLLYFAGLGVFCLAIVTVFRNVGRIDNHLSHLSPYSTLADWVNIHAQSGLRLRIPQPIFVRVRVINDCQLKLSVVSGRKRFSSEPGSCKMLARRPYL